MQPEQTFLLSFDPGPPPETVSKKGFAELIGVSQGRVSQLITAGLPVEPNGRIHVARGKAWMRENIDQNRRRASLDDGSTQTSSTAFGGPLTARGARDVAEAEIARLKAERLSGRLIDRRATLRMIETRAKFERDALIGWVNRVAPAIAAATGADLSTVTAVLDREVRDHLVSMAEKPLEMPQ